MNTLDVLTDARALVEKGWLQGNWYRLEGPGNSVVRVCTAGAIRLAAQGVQGRTDVICRCGCGMGMFNCHPNALAFEAERVFAAVLDMPRDCIPEWNDSRGRTKAEVLAVFDKAIEALTPPPTYDAAACIAEAVTFGQSKVTYTIPTPGFVWVPDTVPSEWSSKVLVNTA